VGRGSWRFEARPVFAAADLPDVVGRQCFGTRSAAGLGDWHATRIQCGPAIDRRRGVDCGELTLFSVSTMLRITTIHRDPGPAILKLEGKLLTPWIGELEAACRAASVPAAVATLDLAGISFVDGPGAIALRDLRRRGVRLVGCSPLVTQLLQENVR
jgi:hypothetical protein